LGNFRFGTGQVKGDILFGSSTDHLVDGFFSDFTNEIPDSEVDYGDGGKGETWTLVSTLSSGTSRLTLSTVEHGRPEHLIPNLVGIPRILTDDESSIMFFNQPTSWRSTETGCVSDCSVRCGQFDKDGPEDSDSP